MNKTERLRVAAGNLRKICRDLNILHPKIIGRVKGKKSSKDKKENSYKRTRQQVLGLEDDIGIRVIVKSDRDLKALYEYAMRNWNILLIKDYVRNPRKDGLILRTNPLERYRSYHIFTDSLNDACTEIQLRTIRMEMERLKLRDKYGEGYWKTPEFRKRKYMLGDRR